MKRVAFLFDNDGVLTDSSALHWESWQGLMREAPELQMDYEAFLSGFGKRNELILREVMPESSAAERAAWAEKKELLFRARAAGSIGLLPGMEAFLQSLVAAEIPRIIASSTPVANLEMLLESTVLGKYFTDFVSGEQVALGKPAPDIFIAAAAQLGFAPSDCIVVEDAPVGIAAGKAAGAFVVALETTHRGSTLQGYDLLYPSPKALQLQDILDAFTRWQAQR